MELILVIHLFATFFMTGLCWFVQVVHYPLFRAVDPKDFPAYERKNFITILVAGPVMAVELLTALWLTFISTGNWPLANLGLFALICLSTVVWQVPIHLKLRNSADPALITKLIRTNWVRTIGWTLRSALLCFVLYRLIQ